MKWLWCYIFHPRESWKRTAYRVRQVTAVFEYRCEKCGSRHVDVILLPRGD